jgi:hypothetical protein
VSQTQDSQSPVRNGTAHTCFYVLSCAHSSASQYAPGAHASPHVCRVSTLGFLRSKFPVQRYIPLPPHSLLWAMCCDSNFRLLVHRTKRMGEILLRSVCGQIGSSPGAPLLWAEYLPTNFLNWIVSSETSRLTISRCHFAYQDLLSPSSSAIHRHSLCQDTAPPSTAPWCQPSSPIAMRCRHLRHPGLSTIHQGGRRRLMRSAA